MQSTGFLSFGYARLMLEHSVEREGVHCIFCVRGGGSGALKSGALKTAAYVWLAGLVKRDMGKDK